jgi:hypothetical protein
LSAIFVAYFFSADTERSWELSKKGHASRNTCFVFPTVLPSFMRLRC